MGRDLALKDGDIDAMVDAAAYADGVAAKIIARLTKLANDCERCAREADRNFSPREIDMSHAKAAAYRKAVEIVEEARK